MAQEMVLEYGKGVYPPPTGDGGVLLNDNFKQALKYRNCTSMFLPQIVKSSSSNKTYLTSRETIYLCPNEYELGNYYYSYAPGHMWGIGMSGSVIDTDYKFAGKCYYVSNIYIGGFAKSVAFLDNQFQFESYFKQPTDEDLTFFYTYGEGINLKYKASAKEIQLTLSNGGNILCTAHIDASTFDFASDWRHIVINRSGVGFEGTFHSWIVDSGNLNADIGSDFFDGTFRFFTSSHSNYIDFIRFGFPETLITADYTVPTEEYPQVQDTDYGLYTLNSKYDVYRSDNVAVTTDQLVYYNEFIYKCTAGGTTGTDTSVYDGNYNLGDTVTDGSVTLECICTRVSKVVGYILYGVLELRGCYVLTTIDGVYKHLIGKYSRTPLFIKGAFAANASTDILNDVENRIFTLGMTEALYKVLFYVGKLSNSMTFDIYGMRADLTGKTKLNRDPITVSSAKTLVSVTDFVMQAYDYITIGCSQEASAEDLTVLFEHRTYT